MAALEMTQGNDRVVRVVVVDTLGVPFTWDDVKVWFTAKEDASDLDDDAVIHKISTTMGQIDLSTPGIALVNLDAADTKDLSSRGKELVYDVQILVNANVYTVDTGTLLLKRRVTEALV